MAVDVTTLATLTVPEAAEALQISENTVKRYLREGKLPGVKIGGQWRLSQELLLKLLAGKWRPDDVH